MAGLIIIASENQYINSTDYVKLTITINKVLGLDENYSFADKNLVVNKWGALNWDYDLEEALLVPSSISLEISDQDRYLDGRLFKVAPNLPIKILIELNGLTEFIGFAIEDSISYDYENRLLSFKAAPNIDILNKQMLYDEDDVPLDPFSYGETNYIDFTDIVEDIYKLVNTSVAVDYSHDWIFNVTGSILASDGLEITNATHVTGLVTLTTVAQPAFVATDNVLIRFIEGMTDANGVFEVYDVNLVFPYSFRIVLTTAQTYTSGGRVVPYEATDIEDIQILVDEMFFNNASGISTCGDLLRSLSFDFGSFTGMIHNEKAFFYKLFRYDNSNLQTLGTVTSFIKNYKYTYIDFIKVISDFYESKEWEAGTFTQLENRFIERAVTTFLFYTGAAFNRTFVRQSGTGVIADDAIYMAKDPSYDNSDDAFYDSGYLIVNLWFNFRGNVENLRVDQFKIVGVDYDFLKNFNYDDNKYQILKMKKEFDKNLTEIEALFLGAV